MVAGGKSRAAPSGQEAPCRAPSGEEERGFLATPRHGSLLLTCIASALSFNTQPHIQHRIGASCNTRHNRSSASLSKTGET